MRQECLPWVIGVTGEEAGGGPTDYSMKGCSLRPVGCSLHCVLSLKEDRQGVYGRGAHHGPVLRELVPGPWKARMPAGIDPMSHSQPAANVVGMPFLSP